MSAEPTITLPLTSAQAEELLLAVQLRSRAAGQGTASHDICNGIAELIKDRIGAAKVQRKPGPERNGKA